FFRLRASPAKTSGGKVASCFSVSASAAGSGYSGTCRIGFLRQLSGVQRSAMAVPPSPRLMVRSVAQRRVSNTQVGFSRLAHCRADLGVNPRSVGGRCGATGAALFLRDAALRVAPQDEGGVNSVTSDTYTRIHEPGAEMPAHPYSAASTP